VLFRLLAIAWFTLCLTACATQGTAQPTLVTIASPAMAGSTQSETEGRLRAMLAAEQRLSLVFSRLTVAGADLCTGGSAPWFGFRFWSADGFHPDIRAAAGAALGVEERRTVFFVAPDQPAGKAGVLPGDVLVGVLGKSLASGPEGEKQFDASIAGSLKTGADVVFNFERAGVRRDVSMKPLPSCPMAAGLIVAAEPNAATNGQLVIATTGLLAFASSDRDLATILGHEIAHAIRRHPQRVRSGATAGATAGLVLDLAIAATTGVGSSTFTRLGGMAGYLQYSVEFEMEADYVGLYLAARAGYDVTGAAGIWKRLELAYPDIAEGGWSHPPSAQRFEAMSAAEREIAARRARGEPLTPIYQPDV
jgi:hypothetical protein